ncbi:MAG TPA: SUMF1/EgtB/PvdO family nonheme iron enzyme [Nitrospirales bacterium]|nr:SUMF1/EgtB/PvdO family nonheme iron enzyme [Nitrospirales bacterium]
MKRSSLVRSVIVVLAVLLTAPVASAEIQNLVLPPQPAGGPTTGVYWALIIGIDNYHHGLPLQTAVRDALEVRDELAQRYGVQRDRILELLNEQATRQNIAYALFRLSNDAKPDDIVLIYFAGHAQYDKDGRLQWWLPVEGTPLTPETLLTDIAIQEELQGMKAKQVHLFHVMTGVARELHLGQPNLQAEREAIEHEQRQAEERAKSEAARRQEEERNRLAAEEARRAAEEQARLEAERLAREKEALVKQQAEQQRLEEERRHIAEEQAKREAEERARLDAERLAREQEELVRRQAEQKRLEEERLRLAEEQARQEDERRAKREQERLAREREERTKQQAEQQRLEEEHKRAAAEQARREEAQRKLTEERRRAEEQAKARAEQRSKPIEEARVRPFTPPPAGRELLGKDGTPMVLVPAGEFTMGGDRIDNPRHPVYLDAFHMDKYEVTTARYAGFLKTTGRQLPYKWSEVSLVSHGGRPVIGVTWEDADAYCRWAGKRLPTEAEWEKAARGTDGREYPWGNEAPTSRHANFNKCCEWKGYGVLAIVGSLEAGRSPYGIYDLAGNVSEWVADWYDKAYYKYELDRNPKGPADGEEKVVRGGSWFDGGSLQRSALRSRSYPSAPSTDRGFRCAKDAK